MMALVYLLLFINTATAIFLRNSISENSHPKQSSSHHHRHPPLLTTIALPSDLSGEFVHSTEAELSNPYPFGLYSSLRKGQQKTLSSHLSTFLKAQEPLETKSEADELLKPNLLKVQKGFGPTTLGEMQQFGLKKVPENAEHAIQEGQKGPELDKLQVQSEGDGKRAKREEEWGDFYKPGHCGTNEGLLKVCFKCGRETGYLRFYMGCCALQKDYLDFCADFLGVPME